MHQNIVTVAQEMNKDRQQFHWLRGKISLWKVDPDDKTRMKMIDHQVGQARASARSAEQQQARDDKVQRTGGTLHGLRILSASFLCLVWAPPRRELWVTVGFLPSLQPCQPSIILGQPFVERTITEGTWP